MNNIINLVKMSYSNFNAVKKTLMLSIGIFAVISIFNPTFLNMLIGMAVYSSVYQVMAYEDTYGIDNLIGYVPVTRDEYVISRYVLSFINIIIGSCICIICYYIASKYSPEQNLILDYRFTLYTGVTSAILLVSVSIPLVLKFGVIESRIISTIILLSIIMVPAFAASSLDETGVLNDIIIKMNEIGMPTIFIILNILIVVISYLISKNVYNKKEIL